ncbi:hypothetical protein IEO21_04940 [Rhodonia placenta]|uniref:Uncharacterized protein n=1 Tax=Rhodonia placenta TaxID=104341 RepID=A0A8H7U2J5_9APHY|nr:hypothetical protein IEO21_04940 [Postia placenta]
MERSTSQGRPGASRSPSVTHYRQKSRGSSRAPSPSSSFSHSYAPAFGPRARSTQTHESSGGGRADFQSPLVRLRRAPLLQVFVPSPEGAWLSDANVLACEGELQAAGVMRLMRAGDVVWDIAVGDEANVGRMVWDGSYLIDLDYTWSPIGDVPHYLPTLAFPPSYFHRVIRTAGAGNPVCHIDISSWGEEIAKNLNMVQDRARTETPQGSHHTVVRWMSRSKFTIRPPAPGKPIRIQVPPSVGPGPGPGGAWVVDPSWYGTVVVETESTNESIADLQARCGNAFPPRATGSSARGKSENKKVEDRQVFRILRDRSRPGEIWIRTVTDKERLLPR